MPNPKRRHTRRRRDTRRSANWKIKSQNTSNCPQCGAKKLPHRICKSCGFYNGELIMPRKESKDKKQKSEENEQ